MVLGIPGMMSVLDWTTRLLPALILLQPFDNLCDVPLGGIPDPPILVTLLHALQLSGCFSVFKENCRNDLSRSWILDYPAVSFPRAFKSFQSAALSALSIENKVSSLAVEMHEKVNFTLQPFAPFDIPFFWWEGLYSELMKVTPYIKTCWLKTACGAWCTSTRHASFQDRPCIFACEHTRDELCHYLVCPILWQSARCPSELMKSRSCFSLDFVFWSPRL